MTKEEKEMLIKDLCARLPYGVKVNHLLDIKPSDLFAIDTYRNTLYCFRNSREEWYKVEFIKPYLRPMSSMSVEERKEYHNLCYEEEREQREFGEWVTRVYYHDTIESIDWLNAHHFDYRGLIPLGLALEAPEGMYNN